MQHLCVKGTCAPADTTLSADAAVAQLVERVLGKDEVTGSNPVSSFRFLSSSGVRPMRPVVVARVRHDPAD